MVPENTITKEVNPQNLLDVKSVLQENIRMKWAKHFASHVYQVRLALLAQKVVSVSTLKAKHVTMVHVHVAMMLHAKMMNTAPYNPIIVRVMHPVSSLMALFQTKPRVPAAARIVQHLLV